MSDAGAPVLHLLYLHGFRSSPQSAKARRVGEWLRAHRPDIEFFCPQLSASPREAMGEMLRGIEHWPATGMAVVGSSLGGFYATSVAERVGCRCAVLNPAVAPARDLADRIGTTTAWHSDEPFEFRADYVDALRAIAPPATLTRPERYLAVIAKGDELLSWREMSARYAGCRIKLIDGSDHALSDFDRHLPDVVAFLGLTPPSGRSWKSRGPTPRR